MDERKKKLNGERDASTWNRARRGQKNLITVSWLSQERAFFFFFLVEVVQGNSFIFSASRESRANDFQLVSTIFER